MSGWTDALAARLGVPPLTRDAEGELLRASRDVAHRVERKDTPVSAYLMGVAAGRRIEAGADPDAVLRDVLATLADALPPPPALGP